jgi:4-diphosphocytidyl-2-C-methyl-D-erythritol kinase
MPESFQPTFIQAPAKINLTLDVLGKRADGYHELASVMQTIALADTIALWPAPEGMVSLNCDVAALDGDENLVVRAARLILAEMDHRLGVRIELRKAIPAQGGLGGGSSDGAAVLVALNRLWRVGLSQDRLIALAAELGSDVPFFIVGGTALIGGRGERVTALPDIPPFWLVIVKPAVNISTATVFRGLAPTAFGDGAATRDLVAHLRAGTLPPLNDATLHNALEAAVMRQYPAVAVARETLLRLGAPCVRMSGSGPTLYIPCATLAEASQWHQDAVAAGLQAWLTHTLRH